MKSVEIQVNEFQYDWLEQQQQSRVVLIYGGSSAGKSFTLKQFLVLDKMLSERNKVFYILRKTNPSLKRSVYKMVIEFLNEVGIKFEHNKSDQVVNIPGTGNQIYFTSLDDPEKMKSVEANYIWLEEATDFTLDDYKRAKIALRRQSKDKKQNQLYLTFNPISIDHWIYKLFFVDREQASILKCTYKENPFLTQDDIDTLEQEKDSYYYSVYCLGNFGTLDSHNCVMPASLIYNSLKNEIEPIGRLDIGVDVARFGDDEAVIYYKIGGHIYKPITLDKSRTTDISESVISLISQYGHNRNVRVNIDVTGVGSGVVDELYRHYIGNNAVKIVEINFGGTAANQEKYANKATEMYYRVRELLEQKFLQVYNDDVTINQLSTRTFTIDNKSRLILTSKDKHKKQSGESPDRADAFCLMCYDVEINRGIAFD